MTKTLDQLSEGGKDELATAILLWKDFKSDGKFAPEITLAAIEFAEMLGVADNFNKMLVMLPPVKIVPRDT